MKRGVETTGAAIIILLVLVTVLGISGCGKKGDPTARIQEKREAIRDLQATAVADGVMLNWTMGKEGSAGRYVRIMRSEMTDVADACPKCPQDYTPLIKLAGPALRQNEGQQGRYRYLDRNVTKGRYYSYRLIWGEDSGPESEASNIAEIMIKQKGEI